MCMIACHWPYIIVMLANVLEITLFGTLRKEVTFQNNESIRLGAVASLDWESRGIVLNLLFSPFL